jgi:hypothetical protein
MCANLIFLHVGEEQLLIAPPLPTDEKRLVGSRVRALFDHQKQFANLFPRCLIFNLAGGALTHSLAGSANAACRRD